MQIVGRVIDAVFEAPKIPVDRKQGRLEILGRSFVRALGLILTASLLPFVLAFSVLLLCILILR